MIGSVRDESSPASTSLRDIKPGSGSRLILVKIANTSRTDAAEAVEKLKAAGISSLGIVIANSGIAGRLSRLEAASMGRLSGVL